MISQYKGFQENIISINSLGRSFGSVNALNDISINVRKGQVVGLIGECGAGKTTLIKHILGVYRAQKGSVKVLDEDPAKRPEVVLRNIGYVAEEPDFPGWMRVSQFIKYKSAFYQNWSHDFINQLIRSLGLDETKKISALSKGQRAQLALCCAQAYKPELLLFDEPSSGLDPIVRMQILDAVVETAKKDGRTIIFSSHLLEEVERVCDHLVMINNGRIVLSDSTNNILKGHFRLKVKPKVDAINLGYADGVLQVNQVNGFFNLDCFGEPNKLISSLCGANLELISQESLSLNDIFLSRSKQN